MRFVLILLLVVSGCGPTIQSGGFTVKKYETERAFERIAGRAAFELRCPKEQLRLTTLNVIRDVGGDDPTQIGVDGCGQRAVYVRVSPNEWIMNTESTQEANRGTPGRG